jgi:hypothetical protein
MMKKGNGRKKEKIITLGTIAFCAACLITAAGCSPSPQTTTGLTPGRAEALRAVAMGLLSLVTGGLALARSAGLVGSGSGRAGGVIALVSGIVGMVLGVVHLGQSTGGFGTGGGRAGAIAALVLAMIGINLGGLVLWRSRRPRGTDELSSD